MKRMNGKRSTKRVYAFDVIGRRDRGRPCMNLTESETRAVRGD